MYESQNRVRALLQPILKRYLRGVLGVVLLAALLFQVQWNSMTNAVTSVNWWLFSLALLLACFSNLVCSFRWAKITNILGTQLSNHRAITLYFRGVAANTILPGGIIGGDLYRVVALTQKGSTKFSATASVFLDRISGLWGLSLLSLLTIAIVLPFEMLGPNVNKKAVVVYAGLLCVGALIPVALAATKRTEFLVLQKTIVFSAVASTLSATTFYLCLLAAGGDLSLSSVFIVSTGVFLGATLPASIGGFGSREVASVFFLSFFEIATEKSFLASILFGLTATIQGGISIFLDPVLSPKD